MDVVEKWKGVLVKWRIPLVAAVALGWAPELAPVGEPAYALGGCGEQ